MKLYLLIREKFKVREKPSRDHHHLLAHQPEGSMHILHFCLLIIQVFTHEIYRRQCVQHAALYTP